MRIKTLIPILLVLLISCISGCSSAKNKLPKYKFMIVKNQEIQSYEAEEVRNSLMNLDTIQNQFHNKPDFVIYAHSNEKVFDMFCVYLDEGLIYQGDVFKAMLDDLTDNKSNCLKMDEETLELLKDLDTSY